MPYSIVHWERAWTWLDCLHKLIDAFWQQTTCVYWYDCSHRCFWHICAVCYSQAPPGHCSLTGRQWKIAHVALYTDIHVHKYMAEHYLVMEPGSDKQGSIFTLHIHTYIHTWHYIHTLFCKTIKTSCTLVLLCSLENMPQWWYCVLHPMWEWVHMHLSYNNYIEFLCILLSLNRCFNAVNLLAHKHIINSTGMKERKIKFTLWITTCGFLSGNLWCPELWAQTCFYRRGGMGLWKQVKMRKCLLWFQCSHHGTTVTTDSGTVYCDLMLLILRTQVHS